jgi:hypothetical protein
LSLILSTSGNSLTETDVSKSKGLHPELWAKWQLVTQAQYRVLRHLAEPGEPLLFIQELRGGGYRTSVSNNEHTPGFGTKIPSKDLHMKGYLVRDDERTWEAASDISVYRISMLGIEAVIQYKMHGILKRQRKAQERKIAEKLIALRKAHGIT